MRLDNAQMKTLKSQLRLRPSYNELIKEITKEEFKNKNIRDVIDRNAYYFRDSPLGTVYDNTVDLRQQHFKKMVDGENQTKYFDISKDDEMDDLRDGSIQTLSATMDDAEEQHERQISQISKRLSSEQIADLHQRAQRARQLDEDDWQSVATAKSSNYDDLPALEEISTERMTAEATSKEYVKGLVNRQSRDVARKVASSFVKQITENKAKELEKRIEQKMDTASSSSTLPARQTRTHKETIDYSTDINHWKGSTVKEEDILFQLYLRGAGLTEEQEQQYSNTKKKGKGKKETGRTYLVGLVDKLINSGKWTTEVNDELLRKRMNDWKDMKGKGKATKEK